MDLLFIIYSCKKNAEKSHLLYNLILERLQNCKCYILYGDPNLQQCQYKIDDKYIVIKCGDNYENLSEKSISLFKTIRGAFPNIKGILKCDDDIIPNIKKLNELITFINQNNIDYLGHKIISNGLKETKNHFNKCSSDKYNIVRKCHACEYTAGPLYYLNTKAMDILINSTIDYNTFFFEDTMVGYFLNKQNIFPHHFKTYYDNMEYDQGCLQNHKGFKILYVHLHGGLGNQLFQVSAAYFIAKQKNMILVLLYRKDGKFMTHNSADEFMKTIFSYFNYTYYENIDISKLKIYKESKCFGYNANIINENENYLLDGYFQHKNYITNNTEILSCFKNEKLCNKLLLEYPLLSDSFFIHVRLGDYAKNPNVYSFDKDSYYKKSIDYILERNNNAHFFILSDDVGFIKNYSIFTNINKTIISNMNTLDSLYFMSLCKKGGICANSTFSGWGSKLNENTDKLIICPKQWIKVDYAYDIPFDYTIAF
jgi:hypothetical protein